MSREIKFRAWGIDTFPVGKPYEMAYFSLKDVVKNDRCCITGYSNDDLIIMDYEDSIIMQFIGLLDKNGVEIYEGDIVEWDDNSNGKWRRRCLVVWDKSHYSLKGYYYDVSNPEIKTPIEFNFGAFIYEKDGELEIIGDIYRNPELLTIE